MIEMKYPRPVRRKLIAGVYHFWLVLSGIGRRSWYHSWKLRGQ
jgi:hypothetical protein